MQQHEYSAYNSYLLHLGMKGVTIVTVLWMADQLQWWGHNPEGMVCMLLSPQLG